MPTNNFFIRYAPIAWLAAIAIGLYAIFAPSGYLDYLETRDERVKLEARIAEIEAENRRLEQQIRLLHNDLSFLEQLARDKLGMVYPDEKIVIVPPRNTK